MNKLEKYTKAAIESIKKELEINPNHYLVDCEVSWLRSIEDIEYFIKEWNKEFDFFVFLQPSEGFATVYIKGDKRRKIN